MWILSHLPILHMEGHGSGSLQSAYYAGQAGAKVHSATYDIQDVYSLCDQGSIILFFLFWTTNKLTNAKGFQGYPYIILLSHQGGHKNRSWLLIQYQCNWDKFMQLTQKTTQPTLQTAQNRETLDWLVCAYVSFKTEFHLKTYSPFSFRENQFNLCFSCTIYFTLWCCFLLQIKLLQSFS